LFILHIVVNKALNLGWWHGVAVTHCVWSMKLLYTKPS